MSPASDNDDDHGEGDESFTLTDAQQRAVRTLDRNVTLAAGAGSGKTTTLTERYMAILRVHLDGPETLSGSEDEHSQSERTEQTDSTTEIDDERAVPYRLGSNIEQITDPAEARRLPERIVVTTFTERAAEELKHEIREQILDRLDDIDDLETWRRWRAVADGLESAYIHTIHSLCNRLLEEYATVADAVDPNFDVLEDEEQDRLVNQIATELVEEEPPEVGTLAQVYSRSQLVTILADLVLERRLTEDWLELMESLESQEEYERFLVSLEGEIGSAERLYRDIEQHVETVCRLLGDDGVREDYGAQPMNWFGADLREWWLDGRADDSEELSTFDHLARVLDLHNIFTNDDNDSYAESTYFGNSSFREREDSQAESFHAAMEALLETLHLEAYDFDGSLDHDRAAYDRLQALASLSQTAIERYQQEKARRGALDYDDLIEKTRELLTERSDDQLTALREKLWYVMVDEFQDTNHRQWELVQTLVTEGEFDADNVFLVGDKKQSIYRFRNADVTVFDAAQSALEKANDVHGTPDDGQGLQTNFRTLPETLDAINGLFEHVFSAGPDNAYEASPEPLAAGRTPNDAVEPCIEYLPVPVETDLRERFLPSGHDLRALPESESSDIESRALANRIAELLAGDTTVTAEDDESDASPVTPGDIAVLIRSRSDLKEYERALRRLDIPYRVVKGEGFFETPEIRALRALLEALVDPTDEIALYGALRSPLCGLADEEIADEYDPSAEESLWAQLQSADTPLVQTTVADIQHWRRCAGTAEDVEGPSVESWSVLLDTILKETGYLAAVAADERRAAATANVDKFRDKLREFDADGVPSLERVVRRLDIQATEGGNEADANVVRSDESVTIMTIHEAKGQEFPTVVIPGIGREFLDKARIGNGSIELERVTPDGDWREASTHVDPTDQQGRIAMLGIKVPGKWGEGDQNTFGRYVAQTQRRREEYAEEKRILYVGCTRAEDHLILTGQHTEDDDEKSDIKAPEPEDPSSMRDWVQDALFGTGEDAVVSWSELETDGQFERELEFEMDGEQSGTVTVRLPPRERDVAVSRDETEPETQRTPYTPGPQWEIRTSPSDLSGLADGSMKWDISADTRQARTVRTDDSTEESEQAQRGLVTDDGNHLRADVFGEAVHRLCEVQPPREEWQTFIRQVATAKRNPGETLPENIPPAAIEAVSTAATSALDYLESLHDQIDPLSTHDEFPISLAFDGVELTGYIDHLAVGEETYYVVDYKTDRQRSEESNSEFLDRGREHHEPQVMAYAAALQAHDPTRDIDVRLYFTDIEDSVQWTPGELESAEPSVRTLVSESLPDQLTVEDN